MSKVKILIGVCITILLIGIIGVIYQLNVPNTNLVNIIQDGKILQTIDISKSSDTTIEVQYNGHKNVIKVQNHTIFMDSADCPDGICIKSGVLTNGVPIVCLPNHLVIEFANNNY